MQPAEATEIREAAVEAMTAFYCLQRALPPAVVFRLLRPLLVARLLLLEFPGVFFLPPAEVTQFGAVEAVSSWALPVPQQAPRQPLGRVAPMVAPLAPTAAQTPKVVVAVPLPALPISLRALRPLVRPPGRVAPLVAALAPAAAPILRSAAAHPFFSLLGAHGNRAHPSGTTRPREPARHSRRAKRFCAYG